MRRRIKTEERKITLSVRRRAPTVLLATERSVDDRIADKTVVIKRNRTKEDSPLKGYETQRKKTA
jgi:hypothetical protein